VFDASTGSRIFGLGCFECFPRAVAFRDLALDAVALEPVDLALLLGVVLIFFGGILKFFGMKAMMNGSKVGEELTRCEGRA
jgi:hypothetical protein